MIQEAGVLQTRARAWDVGAAVLPAPHNVMVAVIFLSAALCAGEELAQLRELADLPGGWRTARPLASSLAASTGLIGPRERPRSVDEEVEREEEREHVAEDDEPEGEGKLLACGGASAFDKSGCTLPEGAGGALTVRSVTDESPRTLKLRVIREQLINMGMLLRST